jgi:NAD(P)-dependent dehydrogenase (short-subunit alcohol dehydrogenase family)
VVTGCASGIGRAIARRFLEEGAIVVGLDVSDAPDDLVGDQFSYLRGDVREERSISAAIASAAGGGSLDIFVNNAAIQLEKVLDDTTVEEFDELLAVNLRGVFIGCKLAATAMTNGGSIINLGSVLGFTGDPLLAAYSATKGGVVNLTRSAALAYARRGIRVNAICPGAVLTELTTRVWALAPDPTEARRQMERIYPMGRIVLPEEIASIAVFLGSSESSAMTGSMIVADAGLTAANAEFALVNSFV